ncbi:MAG: hypothetical protein RMX68_013930 [Aulosira sp. ZfuVER01]|nr:hypothetical protein [Aulosira sp. ZfuVER01]MDZ7996333.1 hypothetical protein [Aulosira sp. DedVER01a]MDZ8053447.1 hypothetical protein [Aulosira sp. ZfuCHP01]
MCLTVALSIFGESLNALSPCAFRLGCDVGIAVLLKLWVERSQALTNPLYAFDIKGVLIGGAVQNICILSIIAISVLKPWGRRIIKSPEQSTAESSE